MVRLADLKPPIRQKMPWAINLNSSIIRKERKKNANWNGELHANPPTPEGERIAGDTTLNYFALLAFFADKLSFLGPTTTFPEKKL